MNSKGLIQFGCKEVGCNCESITLLSIHFLVPIRRNFLQADLN